ncbi:MAG TPA: ABC transporter permease [Allosphingosinicella sp.]|nr:ABC transporter permease [Allosphingosinicella sp.]
MIWRNYMTVAWRAMQRDPLFTIINLFGLAVGLAGCLLIVLFIRYELSFDDWLPDGDRVYQLQRISTSGTESGQRTAQTSFVAATAMPPQFPEIEKATGLIGTGGIFRRDGELVELDDVYITDANFLDVLKLPLIAGDPATALAEPGSIVLTESSARQLLGRTDVLGATVNRVITGGDRPVRVTGVLRDLPANSHLRIAALYRPGIALTGPGYERYTQWDWVSAWVYVRLRPGATVEAITRRMPATLQRVVPASQRNRSASDGLGFTQDLFNIREINTGPIDSGTMRAGTSMKTLVTFGIVAAFLLIVACVNFTNLATARASRRAREVGLRKTLGATRLQLVVQFLAEAFAIVIVAGLLALALTELALPFLNGLLGEPIAMHYVGPHGILLPLGLLLALVGVLSGAYPAFFLSRYRPSQVLKANQGSADTPGAGRLRTGLVVIQFAVSIALIICTAIIYAQTLYARSLDPGYRVSGLLFVEDPGWLGERQQIETFMRRVAAIPGVTSVARVGITPNPGTTSGFTVRAQGAPTAVNLQIVDIDGNAFSTLGMRLLAGRSVTDEREMDVGAPRFNSDPERDRLIEQRGLNVVVDESAARTLGYSDPQAAIGRQIIPQPGDGHAVAPYTIVGVVNDARFASARFEARPNIYYVSPAGHLSLAVRFEGANGARVMSAIETLWKASVNDTPFRGFFADARIAEMYDRDERRAQMFAVFAAFAILISCLGLFGLAAFTAQHRTKEIGIRKVFGAGTRDIVRLLAWQFTRPVLLANLIAWPVAWWAMRNWLSEFENRIDIGPGPFVIAGLLALVIAVGTIAGHAIRVARANPIHALRYE